MKFVLAATALAATAIAPGASFAQVVTPATPRVGSPTTGDQVGPPVPPSLSNLPLLVPRDGPVPANLTLQQALEEAEARSPAIVAARSAIRASEARLRQAGFRENPELSVEIENVLGTGDIGILRGAETTFAVNQRLDLGGRRAARVGVARAELAAEQLRLSIARAELAQQVREQFARAVTARDRLRLAEDTDQRARELARIAGVLVDAGRDPPLRAIRARSAAAQAAAELEAARAEERSARSTLVSLFGVTTPPETLAGPLLDLSPRNIDPEQSLEVRLADLERLIAEANLRQALAATRLDFAFGVGVRHFAQTGDAALVAGLSMPLRVYDRNRGNVAAARANIETAEARRAGLLASATVRAQNAIATVEAAEIRVEALQNAAVPEAFEAMTLTQQAYREGRASLLELLDAQNAYTSAQAALLDARLALALATAELGRVAAQ